VEDGVAIGIVLTGATPEQVPERLAVYEMVRRGRASVITMFSNAGQDEAHKIYEAAAKYMPAEKVPSRFLNGPIESARWLTSVESPPEFYAFNFGYDVIRDSVSKVQEVDPSFALPSDFFQKEPGRTVNC
jgi:salicylate hydroxylase